MAATVGKVMRFDTTDPRGLVADIRIAATQRGDDTVGLQPRTCFRRAPDSASTPVPSRSSTEPAGSAASSAHTSTTSPWSRHPPTTAHGSSPCAAPHPTSTSGATTRSTAGLSGTATRSCNGRTAAPDTSGKPMSTSRKRTRGSPCNVVTAASAGNCAHAGLPWSRSAPSAGKCNALIPAASRWCLGHHDDRDGWMGPEHEPCSARSGLAEQRRYHPSQWRFFEW